MICKQRLSLSSSQIVDLFTDLNNILDEYKTCDVTICDNLMHVTQFDNPLRDINIIHVNIRSIYKNIDDFLVLLESTSKEFDVIKCRKHILLLTIQIISIYPVSMRFGITLVISLMVYISEKVIQNSCVVEINSKIQSVSRVHYSKMILRSIYQDFIDPPQPMWMTLSIIWSLFSVTNFCRSKSHVCTSWRL